MGFNLAGLAFEPPVGDVCYDRQIDPHRQPFPTSDGYICIVPYTLGMWDTVFEILGEPEFTKGDRFAQPVDRLRNQHLLYEHMAELTPARTAAEWTSLFHGASIPAMPVRDIGDILEDPHLTATEFFQRREHPSEGTVLEMKEPVRFSAHAPSPLPLAPVLGQHTAKYVANDGDS